MKRRECRSCGAPVVWARTEKGKRMPLDPQPIPGALAIVDESADELLVYTARVFATHFATCPDAADWRRT